jgi:hypothetical protein
LKGRDRDHGGAERRTSTCSRSRSGTLGLDEPAPHLDAADRVRFLRALVGRAQGNHLVVTTGAAAFV